MGVFIGIVRWRMGMATWSRAGINADLLHLTIYLKYRLRSSRRKARWVSGQEEIVLDRKLRFLYFSKKYFTKIASGVDICM
jgi:hypothetical protein